MKKRTTVLVIGGGAVGVCAAYYLHERGYAVTLVDKGEICSGSSHGNAGLIVPSHSVPLAEPGVVPGALKWMFDPDSPFYIKPRFDFELFSWLWRFWLSSTVGQARRGIPLIRDLSFASLRLFEALAELDGIDFGFRKRGLLHVFDGEEGLEHGRREARLVEDYGIEAAVLSPEEVRALVSAVRSGISGGIYYAQDAHVTPQRFVGELALYLQRRGVEVRSSTEVLGFDVEDGVIRTVKTTRGDMTGGEIVVAAGSWSPAVGRMLGLSLPIQPAKGYSVTVARPADWPETPVVLHEAKVAVTPMMETLRFAGTLELAGFDFSINRRRVEAILRAVHAYLPGLRVEEADVVEVWRGLRPCTPDGLPFLGRSKAHRNLTVAAGHAMIGISLGPITGKLVSRIVADETPDIDIHALRVERFNV